MGCDGKCVGSQFDCTYPGDSTCISSDPPETCESSCNGDYIIDCEDKCISKDIAKQFDLCGDCGGATGDGTQMNANCDGCTNPNAACNSFDITATVYKENSCVSPSYYCDIDTTTGLLDITTIIDLTTAESDTCYSVAEENNCGPGKSICNFFDCNDSELGLDANQSIPCNPELMLLETTIPANISDIGNGVKDVERFSPFLLARTYFKSNNVSSVYS